MFATFVLTGVLAKLTRIGNLLFFITAVSVMLLSALASSVANQYGEMMAIYSNTPFRLDTWLRKRTAAKRLG